MFEVTVTAQVAFSRIDGGGTRRVRLADGTVLEFSRHPRRFEELPPEVVADPYLVKRAIDASGAKSRVVTETDPPTAPSAPPAAPSTEKKGDRVQISTVPLVDGIPVTDLDLSGWGYPELVKLAKDLDLSPFGKKKDELRAEIVAHVAAHYVADPADVSTEPPATPPAALPQD